MTVTRLYLYFFICLMVISELKCNGQVYNKKIRYGEYQAQLDEGEPRYYNIIDQWYTQRLDHSNPTDNRTWDQRYFINDDLYTQSSKESWVFLMIGGEGPASKKRMVNSSMIDYAERLGALCFLLEHRYYGKSHPTEDLGVENLRYLTSQQALDDITSFIVAMNKQYQLPSHTKWIVFGGSYAGSLAAWARLKYPHLIHGAVNSCGPLKATVDFREYLSAVVDSLSTHGEECVEAIKESILEFDELLNVPSGQEKLNKDFQLCDPIQDSTENYLDLSNLYYNLAEHFSYVVQYNNSKRNINQVCDIMTNSSKGSPVNRLAEVVRTVAIFKDCFLYNFDKTVESFRNITWQADVSAGRSWLYQACTEFGFYETSSNFPHVFRKYFTVKFFAQRCMNVFGISYDLEFIESAAERTNRIYGGLHGNISNVVHIHGSTDPWHALGITKDVSSNSPAIYVQGMSHCQDMNSESPTDTIQLKEARNETFNMIQMWLTQ